MKRIILHLGAHKTGTSSFQYTLSQHKENLSAHGIHYIGSDNRDIRLTVAFREAPEKRFLFTRFLKRNEIPISKAAEVVKAYLDELRAEILESKCNVVIISNEDLSSLGLLPMRKMRAFFSTLGKIEIVYCYRDIQEWLSSWSQQLAKLGKRTQPPPFGHGIRVICDNPIRISKVFDGCKMSFIDFKAVKSAGVVDTIFEACKLPGTVELGISELHRNESRSADATRLLFIINSLRGSIPQSKLSKIVREINNIEGPKYKIAGFTDQQIEEYRLKSAEVVKELNFNLIDADELPRSEHFDPFMFYVGKLLRS